MFPTAWEPPESFSCFLWPQPLPQTCGKQQPVQAGQHWPLQGQSGLMGVSNPSLLWEEGNPKSHSNNQTATNTEVAPTCGPTLNHFLTSTSSCVTLSFTAAQSQKEFSLTQMSKYISDELSWHTQNEVMCRWAVTFFLRSTFPKPFLFPTFFFLIFLLDGACSFSHQENSKKSHAGEKKCTSKQN